MEKKVVLIVVAGILFVCLCACAIIGVAAFIAMDADVVGGVVEEWSVEEDVTPMIDDVFEK